MKTPTCQAMENGRPCDMPATTAVWCTELRLCCPLHVREPWGRDWLDEPIPFAALPEPLLCRVLTLAQEQVEAIDTVARLNDQRRRAALSIQVRAMTALEDRAREPMFERWSPPHAEVCCSVVDVTDRLPHGAEVLP